jgi:hypothetical protein
MYILSNGIVKINQKSFIGKLFCKHQFITGENCSPIGMTIISGKDEVTVCKECGEIKERIFTRY